jgi:O-methyltransferase involved in polyketide biosynthesis
MADANIIATADDALVAKYAAVEAGYYDDPYLSFFLASDSNRLVQPVIKRGTHARVCAISKVLHNFCQQVVNDDNKQAHVVILGAGKDTSFFRLVGASASDSPRTTNIGWHEVDYPSVMANKAKLLRQNSKELSLQEIVSKDEDITVFTTNAHHSCHLVSHNLKEDPHILANKLSRCGINLETDAILWVSECLQMYLDEVVSRSLWQHIAKSCRQARLVLYDPIVGESRSRQSFGRVMEQHLLRASIISPESSFSHTRTLSQQLNKLTSQGWQTAMGCDMWTAYNMNTLVSPQERMRANASEMLDEVEEWMLIMQHYCILVATTVRGVDPIIERLGLNPAKCQVTAQKT